MQVSVCRHIRANGLQCQAVALKSSVFCYFHQRLHRTHRVYRNTIVGHPSLERQGAIFDLGTLEDSVAIQIAISKTVNAIATNMIDLKHGRVLLYGLQLAASNARRLNPIPEPTRVVRELHTPPGIEQERLPEIAPNATTEIPDQTTEPESAPELTPTELAPQPTMLERILEQEQAARAASHQVNRIDVHNDVPPRNPARLGLGEHGPERPPQSIAAVGLQHEVEPLDPLQPRNRRRCRPQHAHTLQPRRREPLAQHLRPARRLRHILAVDHHVGQHAERGIVHPAPVL